MDAISASQLTVADLFKKQARIRADATAAHDGDASMSYAVLDRRSSQLAGALKRAGVARGDRVAILSQNSPVFLELFWAAAKIGAIVATQNWRLASTELSHCLALVGPRLTLVSPRHLDTFEKATPKGSPRVVLGEDYEAFLSAADEEPWGEVNAEDGMLIVYTSGTTGLPKGALISHRALIARMQLYCTDFGIDRHDTFFCYSPMFHIAGTDMAIGTLMIGGKIVIADGPDLQMMRRMLETETLSNLVLFPGSIDATLAELSKMNGRPKGIKKFGALADLFPPAEIAAMTSALDTSYANTYACTETGIAPGSGGSIPKGVVPTRLSKTENNFCAVALWDETQQEVPDSALGELVVRGPTLFSGYWNNPEATAEVFAGGWFHTGDLFRRNADGSLDYVERRKYLIKSGGENIYPAEIERLVLQDPGVAEAAVVRRKDAKWGETPVLVVTRRSEAVTMENIRSRCLCNLAKYKCPRDIYFVPAEFWPRNNTGKILRHQVEEWVAGQAASA